MGKIVFYVSVALVVILLAVNYKKLVAAYKALKVFTDEVRFEMSKVTWPTREEVVNATIIVGVFTVILTVLIGALDSVLGQVVRLMF